MGIRFRKSIKVGPARINFSKSGIGWSIGVKGARLTKKSNGGYRTTAGIPGSGVYCSKDFSFTNDNNASNVQKTSNKIIGDCVSPEQRKKAQRVGAIIGVCFAVLVVSIIAWKLFGSLNMLTSKTIYTTEIPNEAVWEIESEIEFVKYPGYCKSGDKVLLEIKAKPNSHYSIVVYTDMGHLAENSLIGTSTNSLGKANWSWTVPKDTAPGIYCIQVSDRAGNKNCIDYYILDQYGNVVGDPPLRERPIENDNYSFTIEVEDIEYAPVQNQTVFITQSGEKYHKANCVHVSSSATEIDYGAAIAQGYTACQVCY